MKVQLKSSKLFTVEDFDSFSDNRDLIYITVASLNNALKTNKTVEVLYGNTEANVAIGVTYGVMVDSCRAVYIEYLPEVKETDYIIYDEFFSTDDSITCQTNGITNYLSYLLNSKKVSEYGERLHRRAELSAKFSQMSLSAKHMSREMYQSMEHPSNPKHMRKTFPFVGTGKCEDEQPLLKMKEEFLWTSNLNGKDPQTQHYIHAMEDYLNNRDGSIKTMLIDYIDQLSLGQNHLSHVERINLLTEMYQENLKKIKESLNDGKECSVLIGDEIEYHYVRLSLSTDKQKELMMVEYDPKEFNDYDLFCYVRTRDMTAGPSQVASFIISVVETLAN